MPDSPSWCRACAAPSPTRGRSDLLRPVAVGVGDYLHHVTVGVVEIDAATAVQMIDLARLGTPRIGVITDAPSADAGLVNPLTSVAWNARGSNQSLPATAFVNGVNVRSAYDRLVTTSTSSSYSAQIWYQHWWTENLRSTLELSGIWNAFNTQILGQGTANNKLLAIGHANLFWSPVAFVDFGLEFARGHRVTVANFKGDANTVQGEFRVRF